MQRVLGEPQEAAGEDADGARGGTGDDGPRGRRRSLDDRRRRRSNDAGRGLPRRELRLDGLDLLRQLRREAGEIADGGEVRAHGVLAACRESAFRCPEQCLGRERATA